MVEMGIYGLEQYMTLNEFNEVFEEAKSGRLNYRRPAIERLAKLSNESNTGVDVILLHYMVMCEKLIKENKEMKKAMDSIRQAANGTLNPYQIAKALGDFKPAYKKYVNIQTILEFTEIGYSYEQIAEVLGVSKSTIYRRMKGYKDKTWLLHTEKKMKMDL